MIAHKERYLRGRTIEELEALLRAGAARVGVDDVPSYPTEVAGLAALVGEAEPGDVVGLMCHAERQGVYDWIADARRHRRHARDPARRRSEPLGAETRSGLGGGAAAW